jgi:nicotinamidase-related amidase
MLLLVDLQNDFCAGGALAVPEGDSTVDVANALIDWSLVVEHGGDRLLLEQGMQRRAFAVLHAVIRPESLRQNDFCAGGALAVPEGDSTVDVANALIDWSLARGEPIVASQDP